MIIKSYEVNKINIKLQNYFLFYGENEGLKSEIIKNEFEDKFTKNIYKYDENEILENKESFFNSVLTSSFFEDKKLIIISRATDKIKHIIEELTEKKIEDIKFIFISGVLEKKSKLRNFFEKDKNLICIPFYTDTNQTLSTLASNFFRNNKVSISYETINLLVERCRGNRQNLKNELNKIENYTKNKKKIDSKEILELTNLAENYNVSELADNCLAKNSKKISTILNENSLSPDDCILIIRTLLSKSKRLLKLQEQILEKKSIDQVISNHRPPIFWKDKEIIKKQLKYWPSKEVHKLICNINELEIQIKKNSIISTNILSDFIISQSSEINN
tara:strand:+ start:619 stop:1614 length:996 start_codon:yes stop_codon:yes gene_type:complete